MDQNGRSFIQINKPWVRHIFILVRHESKPGSEIIMIGIRNRGSWHQSCGGKIGTPHFFRNNLIQENTMINNLITISLVFYGFNTDWILMSQNVRIVLHILLTMLRNPVKLWRKISSSKPKGVSNGSPILLYGKQVLNRLFFNILWSIGIIRVNSFNRLGNTS